MAGIASLRRWLLVLGLLAVLGVAGARLGPRAPRAAVPEAPLPASLADTGLFVEGTPDRPGPGVRPYAVRFPLWSDGAAKERWIRLPPAGRIDARGGRRWRFPVGTRLWKTFRFDGRAIETRMLERGEAGWRFAAYLWDAEGLTARLVGDAGLADAFVAADGRRHDVPSRFDCLACHRGGEDPVLGFEALQLSGPPDPLALHAEPPVAGALDLDALRAEGLLLEAPDAPAAPAPPGRTPRERRLAGYLHGNCGACHRADGPLAHLGLVLEVSGGDDPFASIVGVAARLEGAGTLRIAPGDPEQSALLARMAAHAPSLRMPPLGTRVVDAAALEAFSAWVREDLAVPTPAPSLSFPTESNP